MQDIEVEEFAELIKHPLYVQLIDVRENLEFHTFNVGGKNIPLGQLPQLIADEDLELDTAQPIIVICQRGLRSKTAKQILVNAGYLNTRNLIGGLLKLQRITSDL
ncbi:rhodanese-like domain-containing protein [Pedobacter arcticus]|uniref:rhodanese-like domain-containing protein n=1 Tax=Pedobacter arcticus TaxID=752140 RepID=UPI00030099EC|nr:rhodanese-like domain-containing protein [Pedobacter arcticus]